jgi:hypothetical protein
MRFHFLGGTNGIAKVGERKFDRVPRGSKARSGMIGPETQDVDSAAVLVLVRSENSLPQPNGLQVESTQVDCSTRAYCNELRAHDKATSGARNL